MSSVIIIGGGGHAAELDEYIRYANRVGVSKIQLTGVIDDNPKAYDQYHFDCPFLGNISEHEVQNDVQYIVGIANLKYRAPITQRFIDAGATFLTFVHPSAYVAESAIIGTGSVIAPNVNLGPMTTIGAFNMINARCSIGHDTKIGNFNFLSPNVCFSGGTQVGDGNLFGINSATIPGIKVGNRNKIMAGMILEKNVGDDETVFYRYKEKIIAVLKSTKG
ncbi:sugar O-acyltransferase, sialic acid O-acetyltransferase NeuD family [Cyclonatronum proteinivorum]|uniref:Sugar O-acyltransferase, sialic acid O-acetyltransferase NeuD family n=1 Tax=Cyclonatronum proteinivorum TaxID=1457365 RepID=A0A345UMF5_9BACT|nr:acetyltransferase [Cyclonatronum proteinivorum]AXJ01657.1 sugar O-acyltransferase, sialic acid O-acetyltransferase NeuD family [Cyclonatronum proteinivorum]